MLHVGQGWCLYLDHFVEIPRKTVPVDEQFQVFQMYL